MVSREKGIVITLSILSIIFSIITLIMAFLPVRVFAILPGIFALVSGLIAVLMSNRNNDDKKLPVFSVILAIAAIVVAALSQLIARNKTNSKL